jgi:hypothetical protein
MPLYKHGPYDESLRKRVLELDTQHTRLIFRDLEDELADFCRYVPPVKAHLTVYSTKLWGLILRACAEIDSQLHAVIEELEGASRSTTIRDYMAEESRLQLAQGELLTRFERFPLTPFGSFSAGRSPQWWRDYNSVKHRRLDTLQSATLENALCAVGGLYIVLIRQWGEYLFPRPMTFVNGHQVAEAPSRLFVLRKLPW